MGDARERRAHRAWLVGPGSEEWSRWLAIQVRAGALTPGQVALGNYLGVPVCQAAVGAAGVGTAPDETTSVWDWYDGLSTHGSERLCLKAGCLAVQHAVRQIGHADQVVQDVLITCAEYVVRPTPRGREKAAAAVRAADESTRLRRAALALARGVDVRSSQVPLVVYPPGRSLESPEEISIHAAAEATEFAYRAIAVATNGARSVHETWRALRSAIAQDVFAWAIGARGDL